MREEPNTDQPEQPPEDADQQPEMKPAQLNQFVSGPMMPPPPSLFAKAVCSHMTPRRYTFDGV